MQQEAELKQMVHQLRLDKQEETEKLASRVDELQQVQSSVQSVPRALVASCCPATWCQWQASKGLLSC
jgi:hypothetical protein